MPILAVAAVVAAVNYYNAEKQRGADAARLNEIKALFERIKPPNYDVSIDAPPAYHQEVLQQPQFSDPASAPEFDSSKLLPKDLKMIRQFAPELAPRIEEQAPELIKRTGDMEKGRKAQLTALEEYTKTADRGFDPRQEQMLHEASQAAANQAQARSKSIQQDYARRGIGGSGLGLIAQLQGSSDASNQQAQSNMNAASQAYAARLNALAQGASLGGEIQGQDVNIQQRNADIINSFNQRTAAGRQGWENQRAGTMNDANMFNLNLEQGIANANTKAQNDAMFSNQKRQDDLLRYNAEFHRGNVDRADQNSKWSYDAAGRERDTQNALIGQKASWIDREKAQKNALLSNAYQDALAKAGGMSGTLQMQMQNSRQNAQDQGQAVQGLGNAATSAYGSYAAQQQNASNQANQDDRAQYAKSETWMSPEEKEKRRQQYGY